MSISDVLNRVSSIEQQLQQLSSGTLLDSAQGASGSSTGTSTGSTSGTGSSSADFANALAQAEGTGSSGADFATTGATAGASGTSSATVQALLSALMSGGVSASDPSATATATTGSAALPAAATSELTSDQQQFAATLSAQTGLSPSVVSAWLLAEESGGAAQSRQAQGNNDWLNIGYTDSATYGSGDSVWSDPTTAATATAQWLAGQDSIPGYGTASSGVQSILQSVGQTPAAQIQAIQGSGWSSSGYPSLGSLYSQVSGSGA